MKVKKLIRVSLTFLFLIVFRSPYALGLNLSERLDALGYTPMSCLQVQPSVYDIKSTAVHITVVNDLGESIKPAWLDKSGKLRFRKSRESGATWSERTLAGTVWVWLDETNKQCLGTTVIAPANVQPKVIRVSEFSESQLSLLQASSDQKLIEPVTKKSKSSSNKGEAKGSKDRAILSAFYSASAGPVWKKSDNWLTENSVCMWHGVTCNKKTGRVEELTLRYNNLTGELPAVVGELSALKRLDLDGNNLFGDVPGAINNLVNLTYLGLAKNAFTGYFPSLNRLTKLRVFNVNDNDFEGRPPFILRVAPVYNIDVSNNKFVGDLDFLPKNNRTLYYFKGSKNQFGPVLPARIAAMENLRIFELAENNFSGKINRSVAEKLASVPKVDLSGNNFSCPRPFILGDIFAERREFCSGFQESNDYEGVLQVDYANPEGSDRQAAFRSRFVGGKREGLHQRWFPNGNKMIEAQYAKGLKHGVKREWDAKGRQTSEKTYKEGKLHGLYFTFNSGEKARTYCYQNGKNVDLDRCLEEELVDETSASKLSTNEQYIGTYYVNRLQMDGGRSTVLRLREGGAVDFPKRRSGYRWRASNDEVTVSYEGEALFRARVAKDTPEAVITYKNSSQWNDIALTKLSDSPDYQFDLFQLGSHQSSKNLACFNIGRGDFPYGTHPWYKEVLPITAATLQDCRALCPAVLTQRLDPKYSTEKTRANLVDVTCPTISKRVAKPSKTSSTTQSQSDRASEAAPPAKTTQVRSVKSTVKKVDTANQRMARIAHELNSNKRSFNALYTLEDVKIDYEKQQLNYFFKVNSSIDSLDLVSLAATFKQSYCSAPKLQLFRENNVDAVWRFKDKSDRALFLKASTADC